MNALIPGCLLLMGELSVGINYIGAISTTYEASYKYKEVQ